jgi:amiloride-sensitive sodium channel subunit gamma
VRDLLADLEQETRRTLMSLYGFSEVKPRKHREAGSWSSTWENVPPKFHNLVPLLVFSENEKDQARDFVPGRKRKISGNIIHKASNVIHVHESKLVGFQLVRLAPSQSRAMDWWK